MAAATTVYDSRALPAPRRNPLVIVLVAAAAGVVVDRYRPLPLPIWSTISAVALVAWFVASRRRKHRAAAGVLLLAVTCLAAARHHDRWNLFGEDDLSLFATMRQEPICIEAIAAQTPRLKPLPERHPLRVTRAGDEVRFEVEVLAIRNGDTWRNASGRAAVEVEGLLPGLAAGDRIEVFGHLLPPEHALNPGETDRAAVDRGRRMSAHLRVTYPEAIAVLDRGRALDGGRLLEALRLRARQVFDRYLQPRQASLASAVMLGLREQLDADETEAFQLTGTIHLLVIAGLHLGIIARLAGFVLRRLLPRQIALPSLAVLAVLYMLTVDAHPPIVRATVLIVAACIALYLGRGGAPFNVLGLAGLIVLVANPTDLFNVGPQLSFLCVAGLMLVAPMWFATIPGTSVDLPHPPVEPAWRTRLARWLPCWLLPAPQPWAIQKLLYRERPWLVRMLWVAARFVRHLTLVSGAMWLLTMPLVMARFHIFNPVAVILNTIVWLPMALALASGMALLVCGFVVWPLAIACAAICNGCLFVVEWFVRQGARLPYGHAWVPGPADWWLIGFYGALGLFVALPRFRPPLRWQAALLGVWTAAGLLVPWLATDRQGLHCTFLSVGHGEAIVLELPDGRTVLYDAGRMAAPTACCRSISGFLWSRGLTHIDAVILSHADTDHYNALPELLERFSVGTVYVSPVMFDEKNAAIHYLAESIKRAGVPVRVVASGDRLSGGSDCRLEILHPPPRGLPASSNANSVVVAVEFAGRRVILPADLQSPGLDDVLAERPLHCDLLLVPHHGSKSSLPERLSAWSTPDWAVISADHRYDTSTVEAIYARQGHVLHTADTGAVMARIDRRGVRVETFRSGQHR